MGAVQFTMVGRLFDTINGKQLATKGKLLCIRLLEELYKIGYELDLSSDLARSELQASTLLFRKTACEQLGARQAIFFEPVTKKMENSEGHKSTNI